MSHDSLFYLKPSGILFSSFFFTTMKGFFFSYLNAEILMHSHCRNSIKFKSIYTVSVRALQIGQFYLISPYKQIVIIFNFFNELHLELAFIYSFLTEAWKSNLPFLTFSSSNAYVSTLVCFICSLVFGHSRYCLTKVISRHSINYLVAS